LPTGKKYQDGFKYPIYDPTFENLEKMYYLCPKISDVDLSKFACI
jgi:hypothetical protein